MLLWSVMTLLLGAATLMLVAPLLRNSSPVTRDRSKTNAARVYKDQLAELDRDVARGAVEPDEAKSVRAEIGRRLLASDKDGFGATQPLEQHQSHLVAVAVAAMIVLGSVGLYGVVGSPHLQSSSLPPVTGSAGLSHPDIAAGSGVAATSQDAATATAAGTLNEMIGRIAARVAKDPQDAESWRMLGWSYFATENYGQAAAAYAKAVKLRPKRADWRAIYGETLVRAAGGQVTIQAAKVFAASLQHDAKDPRARFFVGLAKEQAGNKRGALEDWRALLGDAKASDDWAQDLRLRVSELRGEIGNDVDVDVAKSLPVTNAGGQGRVDTGSSGTSGQGRGSGELAAGGAAPQLPPLQQLQPPQPMQQVADGAASAPRGPTQEQVRDAQSMSASDQDKMIQGMVERLQNRLKASPRNAPGWIMLMRSRTTLGQRDKAAAALKRAKEVFGAGTAERTRIEAAARAMGVAQP